MFWSQVPWDSWLFPCSLGHIIDFLLHQYCGIERGHQGKRGPITRCSFLGQFLDNGPPVDELEFAFLSHLKACSSVAYGIFLSFHHWAARVLCSL